MTRHIEPFPAAPDALNYRIMCPDQSFYSQASHVEVLQCPTM